MTAPSGKARSRSVEGTAGRRRKLRNHVSREAFTPRAGQAGDAHGAAWRPDWPAVHRALIERASEPYRRAGGFAYHFARGKLRYDPVFREILELGLLRGHPRILDLGCGQGLLAAWLWAAARAYESGAWPRFWPPPPFPRSMCWEWRRTGGRRQLAQRPEEASPRRTIRR
jgi:hypothetical protein